MRLVCAFDRIYGKGCVFVYKCNFYFDESLHDRKILVSNESVLNIWRQGRDEDKYVGCFVGWLSSDTNILQRLYFDFETNVRQLFSLKDDFEIKSSLIKSVQYRYGLASFGDNSCEFYSQYFGLLKDTEIFWHAVVVSKVRVFIQKTLRLYDLSSAELYSVSKFFLTYADSELADAVVR